MTPSLVVLLILAIVVLIIVAKTAVVVPQQNAYVVERLGRFSGTLGAGFHVLLPFVDVIRYRLSLKEAAYDIPAQVCITRDNVQVGVDGVLYLKVLNAERASYGIADYLFAITQLAQTTLRSEIGKIDLDKTFEERTNINLSVVTELDKASEPWGVKVLRYEIKRVPDDRQHAPEPQRTLLGVGDPHPRQQRDGGDLVFPGVAGEPEGQAILRRGAAGPAAKPVGLDRAVARAAVAGRRLAFTVAAGLQTRLMERRLPGCGSSALSAVVVGLGRTPGRR